MNEITTYKNEQFGEIRTLEENGKVLFCGSDVAKALGYAKPRNALNAHCKGALKRGVLTEGGEQEMIVIPEGDVYRLITHSKLPSAQEFESWVFDEVLPSVRKHGAYMTPDTIEKVLLNPDTIIELATRLKAEQAKVAELTPKAEYYDRVTESDGSMSIRDTAKILGVREREFTAFLEEKKLCFRNRNGHGRLEPYAEYLHEKHWFEMPEFTVTRNGNTKSGFQTKNHARRTPDDSRTDGKGGLMSIKYRFMAAGMTQIELAEEVAKRMKRDNVDMVCDRSCVSTTLTKAAKGITMSGKEQKVYAYLMEMSEELDHGKEIQKEGM